MGGGGGILQLVQFVMNSIGTEWEGRQFSGTKEMWAVELGEKKEKQGQWYSKAVEYVKLWGKCALLGGIILLHVAVFGFAWSNLQVLGRCGGQGG